MYGDTISILCSNPSCRQKLSIYLPLLFSSASVAALPLLFQPFPIIVHTPFYPNRLCAAQHIIFISNTFTSPPSALSMKAGRLSWAKHLHLHLEQFVPDLIYDSNRLLPFDKALWFECRFPLAPQVAVVKLQQCYPHPITQDWKRPVAGYFDRFHICFIILMARNDAWINDSSLLVRPLHHCLSTSFVVSKRQH